MITYTFRDLLGGLIWRMSVILKGAIIILRIVLLNYAKWVVEIEIRTSKRNSRVSGIGCSEHNNVCYICDVNSFI